MRWPPRSRAVRNAELDEEIRTHFRMAVEERMARGEARADAEQAVKREFGDVLKVKEATRAAWGGLWIERALQDLRFALRMLRRSPGFTMAAGLTLALGIGANTAIFSLCNAVLFERLPYADPDRIVVLWETMGEGEAITVSPANFADWRNESRSFDAMAAMRSTSGLTLGSEQEPTRLNGGRVTANFFTVLGVRFAAGRGFLEEEDRPGEDRVAVLSHRVWRQQFGGDRSIVGTTIQLNDEAYSVVGILPPDFQFATTPAEFQGGSQIDVWVPLALDLQNLNRGTHPLRVVAKLAPGVNLPQAQAELTALGAALARAYPEDNRDKGIRAVPIQEQATANVRVALQALLAAVALVLLIACTNVANLLLSRAAARKREMAVRTALGASRMRLAQQMLTESLLLSGLGGVAGLGLAVTAVRAMRPLLPADLSRASEIGLDARMLFFTAAISIVTGILFGLAPLLAARQVSPGEALKQTERGARGGPSIVRGFLAVAQIAIATTLLIGAGLMARSFWSLVHVEPGFRTEDILTARLSLPPSRYADNPAIARFEAEVLERLRGTRGIEAAGFTSYLPLSGADNGWAFSIEGAPPLPVGVFNFAAYRPASDGYFETLGLPLLRGRTFTPGDGADAPWVVVINEWMARRYWGSENPIGQRIRFENPTWRTIIGVVGDVRHHGLDGEPRSEMYMPVAQAANLESEPTLVVRTGMDSDLAAAAVREAISAIDRDFPVDRVQTMEHLLSRSVAQPRFRTAILAALSLLALSIASLGIYGVMTYLAVQRTREFGIRLSLGATPGHLVRLVLGRAAGLIAVGTLVGLGGALLLTRLVAQLLFHTSPLDPPTFALVPAVLIAVALLASYLPARRVAAIDPTEALRHE